MFVSLLVLLSTSLVIIALFRRLRLPPVLGYLFVGLMVGPKALGWIKSSDALQLFAELGVVFLLFSLGLEFSLSRMISLRRVVFGLGCLQLLITAFVLCIALMAMDLPAVPALLLGAGLALSSTAVVSKELASLGEIFSSHGQNAIAVLLLQDIVAVLLLTLLPVFAGSGEQASYWALPLTLGKTMILFVGLLLASRWLLPPLFHEVAGARSAELFVLLALVIVLLTAGLTHLLGLSSALGAFLAGMLLGESHYRHQIEADIRPFRDILLGVFFVSIGMLIDLRVFASHGLLILGMTLGLLLIKGTVIALLVRCQGGDNETAWRSGLALAQGSEFCFALLAQMRQNDMLPADLGSVILTATFCSMVITPPLLRAAPHMARRLHRSPREATELAAVNASSSSLHDHVVICGYGRVGQSIGRALRSAEQPYIALDMDPVQVQEAALVEKHVYYGDSHRGELLVAVGLERARLLVIAVDLADTALKVLKEARRINPTVPILVRTRDDSQLAELKAAGASEVVPELLESSLMLTSHALVLLGMPADQVEARANRIRGDRYQLLRGLYSGTDDKDPSRDKH